MYASSCVTMHQWVYVKIMKIYFHYKLMAGMIRYVVSDAGLEIESLLAFERCTKWLVVHFCHIVNQA